MYRCTCIFYVGHSDPILSYSKVGLFSLYIVGIAVHDDDQGDENQAETNSWHAQLFIKDLQEVFSQLMDAINDWCELGLALSIQISTLEDIESNKNCNKARLREMLAHWLRTSPSRTWSDLCKGLRSDTVKQYVLADTIDEKYNGKCDR